MIDSYNNDGPKRLCDLCPECVGFYTADNSWQAATNSLPDKCETKTPDSDHNWSKFYRKD